ncbi:EscU/YscU/HrcU family type III secretion system export apparatus switch protein [Shewanella sp. JM162201]|uniref:Flagellar biosynthetic protein FlhB n=1 Tax=Shewanella jiangmenensis TaxID=2837387 RepID=A0ABS5UZT9_9GAMM|nr:EscU/YscU/HrcU family type III secretion system export apparatus switch protein [Shewanella jiangmenensis]MBT1443021.1 EscU/YscU/HrcU family type III secretion system export apparatus switch protein [Shewanella jiangmenensis]
MSNEKRLAVALSYDGNGAPTVTAKGEDWLAEDIIALAEQAGIVIHRDPALAQYLSTLDLNETIPRELYLLIAELLSFVYMLDGRYPEEWAQLHHKISTSA